MIFALVAAALFIALLVVFAADMAARTAEFDSQGRTQLGITDEPRAASPAGAPDTRR